MGHQFFIYGGAAWVGGEVGGEEEYLTDCWAFDTLTRKWQEIETDPAGAPGIPRAETQAVVMVCLGH